jgi:DNA-binding MarR family transcriptional regulator
MSSRQLDQEELAIWGAFLDLWRVLASGMERQLTDAGSSGADYQVLVTLAEAGRALRPRDIGIHLAWDRSRVSHQLRRMEQRGLVARTGVEDDARGTLVALTAKGRQTLRAAAPGHVAWVRENFLRHLDDSDAEVLTGLAQRIVQSLAGTPCVPEDGGGKRSLDQRDRRLDRHE